VVTCVTLEYQIEGFLKYNILTPEKSMVFTTKGKNKVMKPNKLTNKLVYKISNPQNFFTIFMQPDFVQ